VLYPVNGKTPMEHAEAPIGTGSQGLAFGGGQVLVQNMVPREIQAFRLDTKGLFDTGTRLKMSGGPAGMRTAEPERHARESERRRSVPPKLGAAGRISGRRHSPQASVPTCQWFPSHNGAAFVGKSCSFFAAARAQTDQPHDLTCFSLQGTINADTLRHVDPASRMVLA